MENFKIECLKCKSIDVDIIEDMDWDWDGEDEYLVSNGYYIKCNNCGETEQM